MCKSLQSLFTSILRVLALLLLVAGIVYLRGCLARPEREAVTLQLSAEVTYQRIIKEDPQRMVVHFHFPLPATTHAYTPAPPSPSTQLAHTSG